MGTEHVIWVVGTQKIVPDLEAAHKRIREYVFPLEDERLRQAYGTPSAINKELTIYGDTPGRITIVFIKEDVGF